MPPRKKAAENMQMLYPADIPRRAVTPNCMSQVSSATASGIVTPNQDLMPHMVFYATNVQQPNAFL